ncbi:TPA: hypothetical protein DEP90_01075 [Patescibacteria group bacterium]|nr:hypothetical protein [Patescibacteria group bacterium]
MLSYIMKNFDIIEGQNRILLSAPHTHIHRRPNLLKKYKQGEKYTDDIVKGVCKKSGSFGIYITDKVEYDPNYHPVSGNRYKKEIENIVRSNKIEKFFDIHGLNSIYDIDVVIYYKTRFRRSTKLAEDLARYIDREDLSGINIQILRLLDNHQESLTEFVASQLRVPAIQIEVARYIREDNELRESFIKNISEYLSLKN